VRPRCPVLGSAPPLPSAPLPRPLLWGLALLASPRFLVLWCTLYFCCLAPLSGLPALPTRPSLPSVAYIGFPPSLAVPPPLFLFSCVGCSIFCPVLTSSCAAAVPPALRLRLLPPAARARRPRARGAGLPAPPAACSARVPPLRPVPPAAPRRPGARLLPCLPCSSLRLRRTAPPSRLTTAPLRLAGCPASAARAAVFLRIARPALRGILAGALFAATPRPFFCAALSRLPRRRHRQLRLRFAPRLRLSSFLRVCSSRQRPPSAYSRRPIRLLWRFGRPSVFSLAAAGRPVVRPPMLHVRPSRGALDASLAIPSAVPPCLTASWTARREQAHSTTRQAYPPSLVARILFRLRTQHLLSRPPSRPVSIR